MTQTLDFSNQDLCDRSFRGLELAGADFHNANIRGCDFRNANLEGADFTRVTTGLSNKQLLIAIVIKTSIKFLTDLVFWIAVAIVVDFAFRIVGVNNIFSFLFYMLCNFFIPILVFYLIWQTRGALEESQNETGTYFLGAKLIDAKFTNAILKNCDFRFTNLHRTDWLHANFNRCKFSGKFDNQLARDLCVSRIGINKDYSSCNLSGLNLVGANLRGANLAIANLNETNLSEAILENTNFCDVQAIKTDFTNATLTGACIENWAITSETIFTNVICNHIYLDIEKKERQPSIGSFNQGDFEKLVYQLEKI